LKSINFVKIFFILKTTIMSKTFLELGFKSAEINGANIGYVYDSNGLEYIAYTSKSASSKDVWHIERRNVKESSCGSLIIFVGAIIYNVAEELLRYINNDIALNTQHNNFMPKEKAEVSQVKIAALDYALQIFPHSGSGNALALADEVYAWLTKEDNLYSTHA
jgi:hypothetical protein